MSDGPPPEGVLGWDGGGEPSAWARLAARMANSAGIRRRRMEAPGTRSRVARSNVHCSAPARIQRNAKRPPPERGWSPAFEPGCLPVEHLDAAPGALLRARDDLDLGRRHQQVLRGNLLHGQNAALELVDHERIEYRR